ncbi:MAG: hypothetical protein P8Y80_12710 [Acidobacteriota bacterium]|jgi:hypothetical protein
MKHLLSTLVIVSMICISAKGEEVTFRFRGTVHELDGQFSYFTGHPFEIIYSFENTTDDAEPNDPESGSYVGAIKSGTLTIFMENESFNWVVEPAGSHNIIEVKNLDTSDSYSVGVSVSGPDVGSEIPAEFRIELIDRDATALSSDELPSFLEIPSFDFHSAVRFTFIGARQSVYSTLGIITSGNAPIPHSNTYDGKAAAER